MDNSRLMQQFEFFREIDKEKFIKRQNYLSDAKTHENDAEHAWHMALMAILLSDYANEKIDLLKTVTMILIHDIVEIDAGDTYAYDPEGRKTQQAREAAAAERLFGMLPEDQGKKLKDLWEEFEAVNTPEARFAKVMDCIQPLMLNDLTKGISWLEHGVKVSQVLERNRHTASGSKTIWDFAYETMIKPNAENGRLIKDVPLE